MFLPMQVREPLPNCKSSQFKRKLYEQGKVTIKGARLLSTEKWDEWGPFREGTEAGSDGRTVRK